MATRLGSLARETRCAGRQGRVCAVREGPAARARPVTAPIKGLRAGILRDLSTQKRSVSVAERKTLSPLELACEPRYIARFNEMRRAHTRWALRAAPKGPRYFAFDVRPRR